MTDIVERLRDLLTAAMLSDRRELIEEAADEIERLRAELKKIEDRSPTTILQWARPLTLNEVEQFRAAWKSKTST